MRNRIVAGLVLSATLLTGYACNTNSGPHTRTYDHPVCRMEPSHTIEGYERIYYPPGSHVQAKGFEIPCAKMSDK